MSNLISKIQFTKNQKKILKSALEPPSTEWLWLKTQNGVSTLYDYVNGKWTPVGGSCRDINHSSEYGDDVLNKGDYVTWNSLSGALDKTMNTVSTWLEGYLKEADFSNYITKDEVSDYISKSFGDVLNGYQPLLTPGQSISLSTNKGGGSTISVKMGGIGAGKSDPVSGNSVYVELQKINEALSGKQAKLVSGTNIKKIQTETYTAKNQKSTSIQDLLGNGSVSVQAPITDLYAIRNGAAAGATAVQSGDIKGLLSDNLKTINNQTIVGPGNITIEGSGGDGTSVTVLNPDESPSSNTGIYFFVDSPLQVEGDYNNLLQTGSDNGYTFSPGNLYSLGYSKRTVNGVEEGFLGFNMLGDHTNLDVRDNVVYINSQMTTMKYYGDVVVSDRIKIADTGTFTYLSFMVACPFAAPETVVTAYVDPITAVSVQYLFSNNNWRDVPQSGFVFNNTGDGKSVVLKIERTDTDYTTKKKIVVHLNNGYKDYDVTVVFPSTRVFFKNGECRNGFSVNGIKTYYGTLINNRNYRTEKQVTETGDGDVVGGTITVLYPTDNNYVCIKYNGTGSLTAKVNGVLTSVNSTVTDQYYWVALGDYIGKETVLEVTASEDGKLSKTKTVTWKAEYANTVPPINPEKLYTVNSIQTDNAGRKYLSIGGSGRQHCILMNDISVDLSKMNKFYIVSNTYGGGMTWCDVALYSKTWWGRFAYDDSNMGRACMFENAYYLTATEARPSEIAIDINKYGHWIGHCYSTQMRLGGHVDLDLYFSFLNASGIIYEFGVITYDPEDL